MTEDEYKEALRAMHRRAQRAERATRVALGQAENWKRIALEVAGRIHRHNANDGPSFEIRVRRIDRPARARPPINKRTQDRIDDLLDDAGLFEDDGDAE